MSLKEIMIENAAVASILKSQYDSAVKQGYSQSQLQFTLDSDIDLIYSIMKEKG